MKNDASRADASTGAFAPFEWMLALRYLRARRKEGFISVISLFSFLGILLGVATLIVVMAVLNGFRAELLDKILGFAGHVAIYRQDAGTIMNDGEIRLRMEKIPGVVRVVTLVEGQAMAGEAGVLPVAVEAAPAAVGETLSAGSGYLPPDGASDAGDLDASRA